MIELTGTQAQAMESSTSPLQVVHPLTRES
jgi:hypothetical protein